MASSCKEQSEVWLRERGIPICAWLPGSEEGPLRAARQVATRLVALTGLVASAFSEGEFVGPDLREWLERRDVLAELSPDELRYVSVGNPSEDATSQLAWRIEAAKALAWALGMVANLDPTDGQAEGEWFFDNVFDADCSVLIDRASLRSASEIYATLDLTLRVHWAIVELSVNGGNPPPGIDPGIIYERHYALNWLTAPDAPWDEISTGT